MLTNYVCLTIFFSLSYFEGLCFWSFDLGLISMSCLQRVLLLGTAHVRPTLINTFDDVSVYILIKSPVGPGLFPALLCYLQEKAGAWYLLEGNIANRHGSLWIAIQDRGGWFSTCSISDYITPLWYPLGRCRQLGICCFSSVV